MTGPDTPIDLRTLGGLGRLALLFMAHAIGTATITLVVATAPGVQAELGLPHGDFGMLVAAYYAALAVFTLPAGMLVDRFGIRAGLIAAQLLFGVGMLMLSQAQGFAMAALGLALCGLGYALVNPSTARAVLLWVATPRRAMAMGVKQTGVPAGGMGAALVVAATGADWRVLAAALAVMSMLGIIALASLGGARLISGTAVSWHDVRRLFARRSLGALNVGALLYAAAQGGVFAYLVLYLHMALGVEASIASLCLGAAHAASAVGRIGWGMLSDLRPESGRFAGLIACGLIGSLGAILLTLAPSHSGIGALLSISAVLGFTVGGYAALIQTAAVEIVEPRLAGAAIAYNLLMTTIGSTLGPAAFGAGIERLGYVPSWAGLAIILIIGSALFLVVSRARSLSCAL
jgi:MFS family permease